MKKAFILSLLMLVSGLAHAEDAVTTAVENNGNTAPAVAVEQKEKTIIVYDVYKHMETSSHIFLGIGGLSLGVGAALAASANGNQIVLGAGLQSVFWGAAETGLYLFDKNYGEKELNEKKATEKFAEMSKWHAIFDLAIMTAGGCLAIFGNDSMKGHGIGIMMQGAMLATYDGINFFIASNPKDIKDWGAGIGWNIRIAGL
jgi:hypothetical protein